LKRRREGVGVRTVLKMSTWQQVKKVSMEGAKEGGAKERD
jgi:hypothetical protein